MSGASLLADGRTLGNRQDFAHVSSNEGPLGLAKLETINPLATASPAKCVPVLFNGAKRCS
jgi:hypothetical protein